MEEEKEIVFGEYDEPELTKEEEKAIYGEIPENAPEIPQTHMEEENYEIGDKDI